MRDETFLTLMRLLPKSALSHAVGWATRLPAPPVFHRLAMRGFVRRYQVDLTEAERDIGGYRTFADFFTRALRPGARPIDAGERVVVSPVDGVVSQAGTAEEGFCLQAKGVRYPLDRLLAGPDAAAPFVGGAYATLYLAPRDYHRIHAPIDGTIEGYSYVPGEFWPVNPASVRKKEALFCVNERLVTYLSTPVGRLAVVKVGATCVARIKAAYAELVTHRGNAARAHRLESPIAIRKGDELGRFEMGSTVILLFEPGKVRWDSGIGEGTVLRVGRRMGEGK